MNSADNRTDNQDFSALRGVSIRVIEMTKKQGSKPGEFMHFGNTDFQSRNSSNYGPLTRRIYAFSERFGKNATQRKNLAIRSWIIG